MSKKTEKTADFDLEEEAPAAEQVVEQPGLDLATWLKTRVIERVTPSGLKIKMRRVGMLDLLTRGGIPEPLLAVLSSGKDEIEVEPGQLPDVLKAFDTTAGACLIDPKVIEGESRDGKLGLDDLPYEDKEFIFGLANEEATALENFRS